MKVYIVRHGEVPHNALKHIIMKMKMKMKMKI